jgi:hypothetical protein
MFTVVVGMGVLSIVVTIKVMKRKMSKKIDLMKTFKMSKLNHLSTKYTF